MKTTKKQFLERMIDQGQCDVWTKEIARDYYSLLPGEENKKKVMAAEVEIKEAQSRLAFFKSLLK